MTTENNTQWTYNMEKKKKKKKKKKDSIVTQAYEFPFCFYFNISNTI